MSQLSDKKVEEFSRARIRRLVDERNVALSAIALRSNIEQGAVKALYAQEGHSKRRVSEVTIKKLEKGMDSLEESLGMVQKCTACGRELPYGKFYFKSNSKTGINTKCKECCKSVKKSKKRSDNVNNNTENAITAETVRKVKAEDKRDVESKFMAPYFRLTPKQLDEIRRGMWDKLLLTKETPKKADTVLQAIEMLRVEVASLRREVETVMVELGLDVKVGDAK